MTFKRYALPVAVAVCAWVGLEPEVAKANVIRNSDVAVADLTNPFVGFDVELTVDGTTPVSFFFELTSALNLTPIPRLPVGPDYSGPTSGITSGVQSTEISFDEVGVSLTPLTPVNFPEASTYEITYDPASGICPIDGPSCFLGIRSQADYTSWFLDQFGIDILLIQAFVGGEFFFEVSLKSAPVAPPEVPLPASVFLLAGATGLLGAVRGGRKRFARVSFEG